MSNNVSFPVGNSVALTREEWLQIATDLLDVGPLLQEALVRIKENVPDAGALYAALDPDTFEADVRAACAAVSWVAEFAADKCRFILVKEE